MDFNNVYVFQVQDEKLMKIEDEEDQRSHKIEDEDEDETSWKDQ
jgi:hypothetical protein